MKLAKKFHLVKFLAIILVRWSNFSTLPFPQYAQVIGKRWGYKWLLSFFSRSLNFVYPYGATLTVQKPAVAVLSSGSTSYPVNRPVCAFCHSKVSMHGSRNWYRLINYSGWRGREGEREREREGERERERENEQLYHSIQFIAILKSEIGLEMKRSF